MSAAEIFYVGGMTAITLGFPTLLVAMWALERAHARAPRLAPARAHKRHTHASGSPYSA